MPTTVVITGGAGGMATLLRPLLAHPDRVLRLLDRVPIPAVDGAGIEEHVTVALEDKAGVRAAIDGADAIVHLGGLSLESDWADLLSVNIDGTHTVLEAARAAGITRVVLASTNHVAGFVPVGAAPLAESVEPAPDTYYGVSKLAVEALGSLFHHRYGLDVVVVRIGSCFAEPANARMLSTWLSPRDAAQLIDAAIDVPSPGFRIVWGQSANTRGVFSLDGARAIGGAPVDDAEAHAGRLAADGLDQPGPFDGLIGGPFCSPDLDAPLPS